MGLDVTVYRWLEPAPNAKLDDDGFPEDRNVIKVSANSAFEGRAAPLANDALYKVHDWNKFGFRAGSYGGYNAWRTELAQLAGFKGDKDFWDNAPDDAPFYELINFSDCEGVIGSEAATALLSDFNAFAAQAAERGGWFQRMYVHWHLAMIFAAEDGAIDFH